VSSAAAQRDEMVLTISRLETLRMELYAELQRATQQIPLAKCEAASLVLERQACYQRQLDTACARFDEEKARVRLCMPAATLIRAASTKRSRVRDSCRVQREAECAARESELRLKLQALGEALKAQADALAQEQALRAAAELDHANEISRMQAAHEAALHSLRQRCLPFQPIERTSRVLPSARSPRSAASFSVTRTCVR
jgi:hypothetical protein